jgi:hypothetical protein
MRKIGDRETLLQVATEWQTFPITTLEKADTFLKRLHEATDGWVILDFLDAANWDCFESHSVSHDKGILQINWHDFIKQDKQEPRSESREMMAMAFPASLYGMAMRFCSLDRIGNDSIACFALRGYALTDKEARQAFSVGTEDLVIRQDRPFSREVLRKINGHVEVIDCITSAAFTVLIVPKRTRIPAHASKTTLYQHNLALVDESLARSEQTLKDLEPSATEAICEKANTIRRNMETLLKLECCFRDIETSKPYSQARIGDLWGLLKAYHTEETQTLVSRFIQWVNELSHDTGIPVERTKAQATALIARMYVKMFGQEIALDYRHLSLRSRDDEYIAF